MSDREGNALYGVAAAGGLLLGVFLLLGAYGHFSAVGPSVRAGWGTSDNPLGLLLPGLILSASGAINIGVCAALFRGGAWALRLSLGANVVAGAYLLYLMSYDLPDHPVGVFLALACGQLVLLGAIRAGLVWPARASDAQDESP